MALLKSITGLVYRNRTFNFPRMWSASRVGHAPWPARHSAVSQGLQGADSTWNGKCVGQ